MRATKTDRLGPRVIFTSSGLFAGYAPVARVSAFAELAETRFLNRPAFLGADPAPGGPIGLSVKLPESGADALDLPFAKPTGYGLGKAGWVSARFEPKDDPPLEILKGWIRESYRAVAPKKLVAELESSGLKSLSRRPRSDRRG